MSYILINMSTILEDALFKYILIQWISSGVWFASSARAKVQKTACKCFFVFKKGGVFF